MRARNVGVLQHFDDGLVAADHFRHAAGIIQRRAFDHPARLDERCAAGVFEQVMVGVIALQRAAGGGLHVGRKRGAIVTRRADLIVELVAIRRPDFDAGIIAFLRDGPGLFAHPFAEHREIPGLLHGAFDEILVPAVAAGGGAQFGFGVTLDHQMQARAPEFAAAAADEIIVALNQRAQRGPFLGLPFVQKLCVAALAQLAHDPAARALGHVGEQLADEIHRGVFQRGIENRGVKTARGVRSERLVDLDDESFQVQFALDQFPAFEPSGIEHRPAELAEHLRREFGIIAHVFLRGGQAITRHGGDLGHDGGGGRVQVRGAHADLREFGRHHQDVHFGAHELVGQVAIRIRAAVIGAHDLARAGVALPAFAVRRIALAGAARELDILGGADGLQAARAGGLDQVASLVQRGDVRGFGRVSERVSFHSFFCSDAGCWFLDAG